MLFKSFINKIIAVILNMQVQNDIQVPDNIFEDSFAAVFTYFQALRLLDVSDALGRLSC